VERLHMSVDRGGQFSQKIRNVSYLLHVMQSLSTNISIPEVLEQPAFCSLWQRYLCSSTLQLNQVLRT